MNKISNSQDDEMLNDYSEMLEKNWSRVVRGKYYNRYPKDRKPLVKITSEESVRYVTLRWLEAQATVTSNRQVIIVVSSDISQGEHQVILLIKQPVNLISEDLIAGENNEQKVTIKTFKAEATVTPDGKLTAQLNNNDIAPGEYKVTLIIEEPASLNTEETSSENERCI